MTGLPDRVYGPGRLPACARFLGGFGRPANLFRLGRLDRCAGSTRKRIEQNGNKIVVEDVLALQALYDELTRAQLGKPSLQGTPLALVATNLPYIGDAQEWKFLPNTAANRARIPAEEAIYLPSQPLAKLWGKVDTGKD